MSYGQSSNYENNVEKILSLYKFVFSFSLNYTVVDTVILSTAYRKFLISFTNGIVTF